MFWKKIRHFAQWIASKIFPHQMLIENRSDFIDFLRASLSDGLVTPDVLQILEGAFSLSDIPVRDVLVPRASIVAIDIHQSLDDFLPLILETQHSRFPVINGGLDEVVGVLLVKDLLRHLATPDFKWQSYLRSVVFIPETKFLHLVLRDFRLTRNHMAIVVDEYAAVVGLITIEDVLERIVGEIEDEFDLEDEEDSITYCGGERWRVRGVVELSHLSEVLGETLMSEDCQTVAGFVTHHAEKLLRRGQYIDIHPFRYRVLQSDSRRLYWLEIERIQTIQDE